MQQDKNEVVGCDAIEMEAKRQRAQALNDANARRIAIAKEEYEKENEAILENNRIKLEAKFQEKPRGIAMPGGARIHNEYKAPASAPLTTPQGPARSRSPSNTKGHASCMLLTKITARCR